MTGWRFVGRAVEDPYELFPSVTGFRPRRPEPKRADTLPAICAAIVALPGSLIVAVFTAGLLHDFAGIAVLGAAFWFTALALAPSLGLFLIATRTPRSWKAFRWAMAGLIACTAGLALLMTSHHHSAARRCAVESAATEPSNPLCPGSPGRRTTLD